MILVNQLIALFQKALDEGWGYIWGAAGATWTQAKQDAATRAQTVKYGQKWVGKRVADCSGLFSWAFKTLGGYMYHGSNTMWKKYCTDQGTLSAGKRSDGQELKPGSAVFKRNDSDGYYHVGLYIGNGWVIEAKGTSSGVVKSKVSTWHSWAELKGVAYDGQTVPAEVKEYALGDRNLSFQSPCTEGADVKELQTRLNTLGFDCGSADGIFGRNTERGLKSFQAASGLEDDGICGANTIAKLKEAPAVVEPSPDPAVPEPVTSSTFDYTVQPKDTLWRIATKYLGRGNRYKEIMELNGMNSTSIRAGKVLKIPKG